MKSSVLNFKARWLIILALAGVLVAFNAALPTTLRASDNAHESHASEETSHASEDEHGGGHHEPAPPIYYIVWFVTLIIAFVTFIAWRKVRSGQAHDYYGAGHDEDGGHDEHHAPEFEGSIRTMGLFLIFAVLFLFFIEGFLHWHEPNGLGFVRFAVKMVAGFSLMFWGLVFMHHEEEDGGHGDAHGGGHGH